MQVGKWVLVCCFVCLFKYTTFLTTNQISEVLMQTNLPLKSWIGKRHIFHKSTKQCLHLFWCEKNKKLKLGTLSWNWWQLSSKRQKQTRWWKLCSKYSHSEYVILWIETNQNLSCIIKYSVFSAFKKILPKILPTLRLEARRNSNHHPLPQIPNHL